MQTLATYRKSLKIICEEYAAKWQVIRFRVTLVSQDITHQLRYNVQKTRQALFDLHTELPAEIFDLQAKSEKGLILNSKQEENEAIIVSINQFLRQILERIDVISHPRFLAFFELEDKYEEFQQILLLKQKQYWPDSSQYIGKQEQSLNKIDSQVPIHSLPWLNENIKLYQEQWSLVDQQTQPSECSALPRLLTLLHSSRIDLSSNTLLASASATVEDKQVLFLLCLYPRLAQLKSIVSSFFNKPGKCGCLTVYRRGKYQSRSHKLDLQSRIEIEPEPIEMVWDQHSSMLVVLTTIGMYIYVTRVTSDSFLELMEFVELPQLKTAILNYLSAQIYAVTASELWVYSICQQLKLRTNFKYVCASSMAYEIHNNRLFISDVSSIYVYHKLPQAEFLLMHAIKCPQSYPQLLLHHGYLFGISQHGYATIVELKPLNKQPLISIITTINIPTSRNIATSEAHKRLIISSYKNCVVLIDTLYGPLCSAKQAYEGQICQIQFNMAARDILTSITTDGWICDYKMHI